ncbi:MAG TPA: sulfatase-like hydrolase/transferase [Planctomycetota bacterium]|nr:sulfatase-like hydrolase/transferase [Planctomycetota bacterium]
MPRSDCSTPALVLTFAVATGLFLGALDATVDILVRADLLALPVSTWTSFGTSSLAGFLAFLVLWLCAAPLRRRRATDRGALCLALSAAVLTLASPTLLACYRAVDQDLRASLIALPLALAVAIAVYVLARPFSGAAGGTTAAALFGAWVAGAALTLVGFLALRRQADWQSTGANLAGLAGVLAVAACLARLAWSTRSLRAWTLSVVGLFGAAMIAGGANLAPKLEAPPEAGRVAAGKKPRHVILVVVDTLRADALSCYSKSEPATPTLDALAADSLFFARPRSAAPWTFPAMSSILTGLAPNVHLGLHPAQPLARPITTLAERMRKAGFLTAAFVRNPALRETTRIDRGFDEFHYQSEPHCPPTLASVLLRSLWPAAYEPRVGVVVQTERAAAWIAEHKDRDFFLWVHYFDPHMAYNPPSEFQPSGTPPAGIGRNFADAARVRGGFLNPDAGERDWIRKLYAGEVRATDRGIAGLFDALKKEGLYDDAAIVFTGDHGDEFWEHGGFEHGHAMYDEVLGVPLFLKLPRGALKQEVGEFVSTLSLTPTLLEVAGVPYDPADLSAPPLVRRDPESGALRLDVGPRPLVSSGILYFEGRTAVIFDGFKYILFDVSGREELYDLTSDPKEQHDLSAVRPEVAKRGRALIEADGRTAAQLRERLGIVPQDATELDARSKRDLQSLGYVDK